MKFFETTVVSIGEMASEFLNQNMIVTFGENAPEELSDFCFIIEKKSFLEEITGNMTLKIGNSDYLITAVGSKVKTNLINLGHITISFTGDTDAILPGTLYVEQKVIPDISVGTSISIRKAA